MVYTKVFQIRDAGYLKRSIHYITKKSKTTIVTNDKSNQKDLVAGHLITHPRNGAAEEMILTKELADHRFGRAERSDLITGKGVLAHHIIQSFSPNDNLTPEEIHEIGRQTLMELTGGHHEFVIATHVNKKHIHNHLIFSTTDTRTLKKFRWQKGTKHHLEKISDYYSEVAGASIIVKENKIMGHTRYSAYHKKTNYRYEIKERLDFLLKNSQNLEDFLQKAKALNLAVDFSGKYAAYRLLDSEQKQNTRERSLSKQDRYSLDAIKKRLSKNQVVLSLDEIPKAYESLTKEREADFEMRLTIEPWQVKEETLNSLYLQVDYGLHNRGTIRLPRIKVDVLEGGKFELFLKKSDLFYFLNDDYSQNDRYMRGDTLMRQLAYNNGQVILNKHKNIFELDQLIREFEFISRYDITDSQQFQELADRFSQKVDETQALLDQIDKRLEKFNKLSAALLGLEVGDGSAHLVFETYHEDPKKLHRGLLEKRILESQVERQVLQEKLDTIIKDAKTYQVVRDHAYHRHEKEYER
ncbi:relaxase/mobilization nuclease domain-containing protein [Streptococcus canis]|uniref:Relaxase/mobilization nuclease domain-containing protein n=1 Tax=Streptococcus canis TaxID=1329 RepID=A0AAE4TSC6_STRCB|nr:relaxase/mobilization nuclease domain-containing protein [Streptococcus canis]MDV5976832.1 relaxase/mobilization nuclease domain-containing protein [Streptococcus canis]